MPFPQSEIAKQRFAEVTLIGKGAFGNVYRAVDQRLHRAVAVKEIAGTLPTNEREDARRRFEREAQIVAQLNSPYVVSVYGLEDDTQQGEQYLYLEYLAHGSLADTLQSKRQLSEQEAAIVARDVARAIAVHAARDIVHRDIKPSNVLLVRDATGAITGAKLSDYGVAQDVMGTQRTRVGQGHPGTPSYMAPEQASSQAALTPAADLYNVGLLLWEMLTGTPRYKQPATPVRSDTLKASPAMAGIVQRALEPDLAKRYSDPAELVNNLEKVAATAARTPRTKPPRQWHVAIPSIKKLSRRQRLAAATVGALALLVMLGGVAYGTRPRGQGITQTATPALTATSPALVQVGSPTAEASTVTPAVTTEASTVTPAVTTEVQPATPTIPGPATPDASPTTAAAPPVSTGGDSNGQSATRTAAARATATQRAIEAAAAQAAAQTAAARATATQRAIDAANQTAAALTAIAQQFRAETTGASVEPGTSNTCPATFTFAATIRTNRAGTVKYRWERSDGAQAPVESITFDAAGTRRAVTTWQLSGSYAGWQRLQILEPNEVVSNQLAFTLTCPPPPRPTRIVLPTFELSICERFSWKCPKQP